MPKRSRIKLGAQEYKELLRRVMLRDRYRCRCCKSRMAICGHHIIYRSHGGDDIDSNVCTLCNTCHDAIHKLRRLVILPFLEGETPDANGILKFLYLEGWHPRWLPSKS